MEEMDEDKFEECKGFKKYARLEGDEFLESFYENIGERLEDQWENSIDSGEESSYSDGGDAYYESGDQGERHVSDYFVETEGSEAGDDLAWE